MDYNSELTRLYEKYLTRWNAEFNQGALSSTLLRQLSCPLLLHVENLQWDNSKYRILFVGQETFGWDNGKENGKDREFQTFADFLSKPKSVSTLQNVYKGFDFGATYTRSPFWWAYHQIRHDAEDDQPYSILWTNLYRSSYKTGSVFNASDEDQKTLLEISRKIFVEELKILKPKAVLFMTGPNYDGTIEQLFPGVSFVDFSLEFTNRRRGIAKIKHPDLPQGKSVRTYHPNYLRRSNQWDFVRKSVAEVCQPD